MVKIAVIPGDGIGREVMPEGLRVLEAATRRFALNLEWKTFPWSCEYYRRHGRMMPEDGLEILKSFEAIFLGAVGWPGVPDHVSLWGLLIPIRRSFRQYANVRPVKLMHGLDCPLKGKQPGQINYVIVRENCEGEYSEIGGRFYQGQPQETAIQETVFTRTGLERIMRFAFELARRRPGRHLTSATKSNGIIHTMPFWDHIFEELKGCYPDVKTDKFHIDALAAKLVLAPEYFDVIVGSNLFGDILSDLGPATTGSLGIAPSANLNPERQFPSLFEPVHGSAPDIAGRKIANPIGQIWSGAMMLEHLGYPEAASAVEEAIAGVIREGRVLTPDLGGRSSTEEVGQAVAERLA